MNFKDNNKRHSVKVAKLIRDSKPGSTDPLVGVWTWVNSVANGVDHFFTDTIPNGFKAVLQHLENLDASVRDVLDGMRRIVFWVDILIWHTVRSWLARERQRAQADNRRLSHYLIGVIYLSTQTVLTLCMRAIRAERRERIRQVKYAEARARSEIRAMHGVIEREAASGYQTENDQRISLIHRLLDFAAERNPELRSITRDIATGLLDLLSIDDPVLRIVTGFLIKQIVDRLGIDKAVGTLISDLIKPLTGSQPPKNLHDTIMDISARLAALEKHWAQFMQDGGSQVEQAGSDWRNITSIVSSIAIVAFTAEAVVAPNLWAAQISDTIGAAANDVVTRAVRLFGG